MGKYGKKSTNENEPQNTLVKVFEIVAFIIIWLISIVILSTTKYQYLVVAHIIIYFIMPLTVLIFSTLIGKDYSKRAMIVIPFAFGIMYSLLAFFEYFFVEIGTKRDFVYVVFASAGPLLIWGIALSYLGILFGYKIIKK